MYGTQIVGCYCHFSGDNNTLFYNSSITSQDNNMMPFDHSTCFPSSEKSQRFAGLKATKLQWSQYRDET